MKKFFVTVCMIVSILTIGRVLAADVEVQINGETIHFEDTTAQIINDRTMVPFRRIFNELGVGNDVIFWDGKAKTIEVKKDNVELYLKIGSPIAKKSINGREEEIRLDSAPVIMNDRTLVPLRFIAESLGKTVGWDAANRTAIIVDYDYFMQEIRKKSDSIYQFLIAETSHETVSITRKYYDDENSARNNTAIVTADLTEVKNGNMIRQNATIRFDGTNELMKEIKTEGWSEIQYENDYYDTYFTTKAMNEGLRKVYGQEQLKFQYSGLDCEGNPHDTITDLMKNLLGVNSTMSVETFQAKKNDFNQFIKHFQPISNGVTTGSISSDSIEVESFDITKLDNMLYDSPLNRAFSLLNSQLFNYDVTWRELCYDYPTMKMTITANQLELHIDFQLSNQYNERVEYYIQINK